MSLWIISSGEGVKANALFSSVIKLIPGNDDAVGRSVADQNRCRTTGRVVIRVVNYIVENAVTIAADISAVSGAPQGKSTVTKNIVCSLQNDAGSHVACKVCIANQGVMR